MMKSNMRNCLLYLAPAGHQNLNTPGVAQNNAANSNYSSISDHDCSAMGMALIPPTSHSLDPSTGGEARPAAKAHWRKINPSQKPTTTSAIVQCRRRKATHAHSGGEDPVPVPASALSEAWWERKKCSAMMMHVAAAHMCRFDSRLKRDLSQNGIWADV